LVIYEEQEAASLIQILGKMEYDLDCLLYLWFTKFTGDELANSQVPLTSIFSENITDFPHLSKISPGWNIVDSQDNDIRTVLFFIIIQGMYFANMHAFPKGRLSLFRRRFI